MLHEPSVELGQDNSIERKSRLGVILFWVYLIVYAGFVVIGTISPKTLGLELLGGVNIAIIYGMGLIILAAIMGLVYNYFCTKFENQMNKEI
jgi:uncharacterized membrane protein (DUF485 family)